MPTKKAAKTAKRGRTNTKASTKNLAPKAARSKSVKGGLLPAIKVQTGGVLNPGSISSLNFTKGGG